MSRVDRAAVVGVSMLWVGTGLLALIATTTWSVLGGRATQVATASASRRDSGRAERREGRAIVMVVDAQETCLGELVCEALKEKGIIAWTRPVAHMPVSARALVSRTTEERLAKYRVQIWARPFVRVVDATVTEEEGETQAGLARRIAGALGAEEREWLARLATVSVPAGIENLTAGRAQGCPPLP